ncbi:zinc ribbon domain-containing protein [Marinobacteraceae bacterium S3BR75-40.1]
MPFYEYVCDDCGHEKTVLQSMSDEPLKTCPECNRDSFRKRISAAGFRLKGSGWYETDFKTGKKKNLADSSGGSGNSSGADSGGTDSGSTAA